MTDPTSGRYGFIALRDNRDVGPRTAGHWFPTPVLLGDLQTSANAVLISNDADLVHVVNLDTGELVLTWTIDDACCLT